MEKADARSSVVRTIPPRRAVLRRPAASCRTAAIPAIAADSDADRELIALCAEFDRLEAAQAALYKTHGEDEADRMREPMSDAQEVLAERMHDIRATTPAGVAARARSLVGWAPDLMETNGDIETLLRSAILRDLTDAAVMPALKMELPPPAVPPEDVDHDKALMAICKQHIAELEAFNADRSGSEGEDPRWDAYWRTKEAINEAEPRTLAGIYAKARAAKAHASLPFGWDGGPGVRWALDIVNDLLRLAGEG